MIFNKNYEKEQYKRDITNARPCVNNILAWVEFNHEKVELEALNKQLDVAIEELRAVKRAIIFLRNTSS